jgi:hypothetical protein
VPVSDTTDQELRALELARLRDEMRLRVSLEPNGTATSGDSFSAKWKVTNEGARACEIQDVQFQLYTTKAYSRYVRDRGIIFSGTLVMDYYPPGATLRAVLQPRTTKDYAIAMTPSDVRMLLGRANAPCPDGWSHDWVVPAITCTIAGPDGITKTFRQILPLVGTIAEYTAELPL